MRTAVLAIVLMTAFSALSQSITLPDSPPADPPRIDPNNPPKLDPPQDPPGPPPDLVISMFAASQNPAFLNENFAVNVEVKNIGAGIATDVNVTIPIPQGIETVPPHNADSRFTCTVADGKMTCRDKTSPRPLPLLYGQKAIVTLRVKSTTPGEVLFQATADELAKVRETSENNNGGTMKLTSVVRPQIKARGGEPLTLRAGQPREIVCHADNIGSVEAKKVKVEVSILSDDHASFTLDSLDRTCGGSGLIGQEMGGFAFDCSLGAVLPANTGKSKFTFTPKSEGTLRIRCTASAEHENTPQDNATQFDITLSGK
jgi:hypothetical protein